ncbi:nuclear transport factor 2 family protein [Pseudomonas fluorescens]|uniref:Nuclear transport factor 2 family protein n=1 Tax=Pseudomonas fluorescens TaxID=294 RepID=A0A7M2J674_PSEFL|nr:nuclear transport factor 2 family protein [Pseudomonas fluorescens]QOU04426.1 nuclear transport factor 2 family protein [Pseudomonas fluorescens]
MSLEKNKQLVTRYFDNISNGKIDSALELLADTATWWVAGNPEEFGLAGTKNKSQFAKMIKEIGTVMPKGIRIIPKGITAEGDRVALEAETVAETTNGKIYNNLYHYLFVVRDGKIQAVREYLDTIHAKDILLTP